MASEINVKQILEEYRAAYPQLRTLTDEEILSVLNNAAAGVNLNEDERISMFGLNEQGYSGLGLERQTQQPVMPDTNILEAALRERINKVEEDTKTAEKNNSWIGKAWSWTKNTFGFGDSTNKVRDRQKEELQALDSGNIQEAFKSITGLDYTPENVNAFLNNQVKTTSEQALDGYKEGQDLASDITGDIISGIAAVGIYTVAVAAAPFTGGASIALGIGAAALSGGLIKSGIKALDTVGTDKKYDSFGHDLITGAFSGLLAPVTGGLGGAVGKTVATKAGIQVLKHTGEKAVASGVKAMLTNPAGYQYVGGTFLKRGLAIGTEMAVDGAAGGAIDTAFRTGVEQVENGEGLDFGEIGASFIQGGIGGFVMAPVIGGGMRGAGKAFCKTKIALNNGKTLEVTEGFGLTYKQPDSNLKKSTLLFNNKPVASTKRDLLKQLKEKGLEPKKDYQLEQFIKTLKTEEDIQRASILFSQNNSIYVVERAFNDTKTLDDVAILSMLWDKKLPDYEEKRALECIRENPLMFNVYQDAIPILGDNYSCILNRTIASKLKTAEDCECFLQIIKSSNQDYPTLEALFVQKGYIPKNIDEAISTVSVLNYLKHYAYQDKINSIESFLTLPLETQSALEKHILMSKENPNSFYYPRTLRKDVFDSIIKDLQDEDLRPSLTRFISKIDDFEELEYLYLHFLKLDISEGVCDKGVIERLNRLVDTGAELIDNSSYYETRVYISKFRRSSGEVVFDTEQRYFDELINVLEDETIKSKLGRAFKVGEADSYIRYIKTDYQRDFVLSHLNKDVQPDKIEKLLKRSGFIKNKEQVALAEFLLDKPDDFKLLKTDYYSKSVYYLFDHFKTKEDIDFFIKLYDTLPMEDTPRAKVISYMFSIDNYNFENGRKLLSMIDNLIKLRPELAEKLNNRYLLDCDFIKKIQTPEVMETVSRNIEILSKADKEFLDLIDINKIELMDVLLAPNFDMEKFHLLKPFVDNCYNTPNKLFEIMKSSHSIERIRELMPKLDYFHELNILDCITPENEKLYNLLVTDPRFGLPDIRKSIQFPFSANEAEKFSITDARIKLYNKLIADSTFPREHIADLVRATNKENQAFAEKLIADSTFPREHIVDLVRITNKENRAFVEQLVGDSTFPREHILDLVRATNKENQAFAEKLIADSTFPREHIADLVRATNKDSVAFAEEIYSNKAISRDKLGSLLESLKIKDDNDAGGNNGKIDIKRVSRYRKLLQDPTISPFVIKLINDGIDMHEIALLVVSKRHRESLAKSVSTGKQPAKNSLLPQNESINLFLALGLNEKEANAVFRAIAKDGVVDNNLEQVAVNLIKRGVSKNKIGDIINSAKITGTFNHKIVDDFIKIQGLDLNPLLERNIAIINNLSPADVAVKFNNKVKNQLKAMIQNLSEAQKETLRQKCIDIESLLGKLDMKIVRTSEKLPAKAKVVTGMRSKSSISGFERVVIDKYSPIEKIWRDAVATRKWAEDKYLDFRNRKYISTRQSAQEANLPEKITKLRVEKLKEWYDFLESDETIKNDPFVRLLVIEFITKDLLPENSILPPDLDKTLLKEILASSANSKDFSIGSAYSKKMVQAAREASGGESVEFDGIKGVWYTVPKTDSSHPSFKENAAKIRAFSDGTNWCIRTWNAEPYLQQGNMHFFVDENGLTQICIRENRPNFVAEIQKRQQNATRPIPYINGIKQFLDRHGISAPDGYLDDALKAKPAFDKLKAECMQFVKDKNYKAILEQMGIMVTVLSDGTWELSHYSPMLKDFTLNDLGIKESDLLQNVSIIRGAANFKDSNVGSLPNLHTIGGVLKYDESHFFNMPVLESINGYKIKW